MHKYLRKIRKSNYVILAILGIVYFGNVMFTTFDKSGVITGSKHKENKKFIGSASCAACHKDIYTAHIKTAHFLDSRPAAKEFIKGDFTTGKNKFIYNKWMEVLLEQKSDAYFQTAFINGSKYQSEQFDMVIGSGRKGQTYLYWNENKLYQLPVSYYTPLNSWCNSPGYTNNFIKFDRIIPSQCLECHSTYAKAGIGQDSLPYYDKKSIVYGIDCERCHGAGADHVAFYKEHPEEKTIKYIVSTKNLNRQQRLDACALCHSGFREAIQPAFSFTAGDKLTDYSHANYSNDSVATLDVHGNQYGLLTSSKCFQLSNQMDCSSCHNVHANEANSSEIFSQRCITCHADTKHPSIKQVGDGVAILKNNCIDCHMPMLPSQKIILNVSNKEKPVPDLVRTHRIGIYPAATKKYLMK